MAYLKQFNLILGNWYLVGFNSREMTKCLLIQTTQKGFNFLDPKTNKCVLTRHLFPKKIEVTDGISYITVTSTDNLKIESSNPLSISKPTTIINFEKD